MRNSILTILLCYLFGFTCLFSESEPLPDLAAFLQPAHYNVLKNSGEIKQAFKGQVELTLVPRVDLKDSLVDIVKEMAPTIGLEYLLLYVPAAPAEQNEPESFPALTLRISNALRAISTLKGIEYYSASRKRMRTFFHDAYVIDNPTTRERLPDPLLDSVPAREKVFIFSNDSSMGENISTVTYTSNNQYLCMSIENISPVWVLFLPAIQPGDLKTYLIILPVKEGLLFYGLSCIKTINLFGLAEQKGERSTYNRLVAFFKWFKTNFES